MFHSSTLKSYLQATALPESVLALIGPIGLTAGKKPEKTGDRIEKLRTSCRGCISDCGVIATVKNGRVVSLEGDPNHKMSRGRMCAKGLSGIQALYNPNRNKYPLIRVGERGENKWRRISWDEAIDTIAKKLMEIREQYGAESVMVSTGGGGNPQFSSIARFSNIFGTPNWFEPGCAQCYLPRMLAANMLYGGTNNSIADSNCLEIYFPDETPMKVLTMWGTDPSYSCPGEGGGAVNELRARGVKTIVIDPRLTPDAAKATVWLPIRPGTDVALQLCWIRYIIEHELYDAEFVMKWTNLPYLVDAETGMSLISEKSTESGIPDKYTVWDKKTGAPQPLPYPWNDALEPELDGEWEIDGRLYKTAFRLLRERCEPYTIAEAARICWLMPGKIEEAVRLYAENKPGGLCLGVATDQNPNSVQAAMGSLIIDILLGNVERPGSVLQRFGFGARVFPSFQVSKTESKLPPEQLTKRLGGNEYKGLHIWHAAHMPSCMEAVKTGKPYPIKAWIDRSGNKLSAMANSKDWLSSLDNLELIVHMFTYPTSFSVYADILLPTTEWLETNYAIPVLNTLVCRQAVTHLYETMDECLIWAKLARRLGELGHEGCAKSFDAGYMGKDRPYWSTMEELMEWEAAHVDMTWEEFSKASPVEFQPMDEWRSYYVYTREDPKLGLPRGFPTKSRKCEAYAEGFIRLGRTGMPYSGVELPPASGDYDPLPYYMEPAESPLRDDAVSREYPLVMTNGRLPYYHHGTLRNVPWIREMYPVPELWINPEEAVRCGVSEGDWVWVESRRGRIRAVANVTTGIGRGVVYMERFWNPENLNRETHGWQEMNVNVLSKDDAPYNDVVGTYTLRGYQVKVYKAEEGAPEGVWTKPADFRPWLPEYSDPTPSVRTGGSEHE